MVKGTGVPDRNRGRKPSDTLHFRVRSLAGVADCYDERKLLKAMRSCKWPRRIAGDDISWIATPESDSSNTDAGD